MLWSHSKLDAEASAADRWRSTFPLALAAALSVSTRGLAEWPFGARWAAFPFPLDTVAAASIRYAAAEASAASRALAWMALALVGTSMLVVLIRALLMLAQERLLQAPRADFEARTGSAV